MDTFNLCAGLASIASFIFAAIVYHKDRLARSKEQANIRVFQERIKTVNISLRSAATILQLLIRRADDANIPTVELQNLARSVRISIYGAIMETVGFHQELKDWKFGQLLETSAHLAVEAPDEARLPEEEGGKPSVQQAGG